MSIQKEIAIQIIEIYKDAQIKKIDVDNFLDIHLPGLHSAKGSHLYFNTAKDNIKIGFYCRDVEFIEQVITRSDSIEKVSNGIRPSNNPIFTNPSDAIKEAMNFINSIKGNDPNKKLNKENDSDQNHNPNEEIGFPIISIPEIKHLKISKEQLDNYFEKWMAPSYLFNQRDGISGCLAEWITAFNDDNFAPFLSKIEIENIINNLLENKAIPILQSAPVEVQNELKNIWWVVPLCFWNHFASPIFINKDGFYSLYTDNFPDNIRIEMIASWESISELEFEYSIDCSDDLDDQPNVNLLLVENEQNQRLSFFELVDSRKNQGSYLKVIEAIYQIRKETINQSKGLPVWKEGSGGEGVVDIAKLKDLLYSKTFENIIRL